MNAKKSTKERTFKIGQRFTIVNNDTGDRNVVRLCQVGFLKVQLICEKDGNRWDDATRKVNSPFAVPMSTIKKLALVYSDERLIIGDGKEKVSKKARKGKA